MSSENILLEKNGHIAKITLNRPDVYNSLNRPTALQFQSFLDDCENDDNIRVIFITGNGKAFSAGQDLNEIKANEVALETIVKEHYNPIVMRIHDSKKIVVAAVNGVAAGAGANIALVCDIVVAKESASFIQAFSKIGLIPDSGGTYVLPRLIGFQKALALALTGDKVSAHEAERIGMIYKVLPDNTFEDDAYAMAEKMAALPPKGLQYTKHLYNCGICNNLKDQLDLEQDYQVKAGNTEDYFECISAFLEKRKPVIKGK